jgi:hypothetical protein
MLSRLTKSGSITRTTLIVDVRLTCTPPQCAQRFPLDDS